jgi:hypothetical protein
MSKPSPTDSTPPDKRLVALLVSVPADDDQGVRRLRSLLKAMLRCWGIRCVAARDPKETKTFGGVKDERG